MEFNTQVQTPYGEGKLLGYREADAMFIVYLQSFGGILYCQRESLSRCAMAVDELEVAFESLEKVRQLNLEVECNEMGLIYDTSLCTTCLLDHCNPDPSEKKPKKKQLNKATTTCIVCGNPTCGTHQSTGFKKQKLVLCKTCEALFDLDFYEMIHGMKQQQCKTRNLPAIDEKDEDTNVDDGTNPEFLSDPALLISKVLHMQDTYGRVMLLLSHDSQYIPELQARLKTTESRNNHIEAGTSASSAMAGVMGLAGAAMILTPFGAPLLLASLAVGGSSSAVSLGNNAVNWYQQPNKAADRIIALHGLACALLKSTQSLLHAAAKLDSTLVHYEFGDKDVVSNVGDNPNYTEHLGRGLEFVRDADDALTLANTVATSSAKFQTSFPRTAAALSQGAGWTSYVPVLGTALSGIFIYMDANRLQSTLKKIQAGNISDKAEALQKIQGDLLIFPRSTEMEKKSQAGLMVIQNQLVDDRNK